MAEFLCLRAGELGDARRCQVLTDRALDSLGVDEESLGESPFDVVTGHRRERDLRRPLS